MNSEKETQPTEKQPWTPPSIQDHDIAEATQSGFIGSGTDNTFYS